MKPRFRPAPDGRIAWPDVVTYQTRNGTHHACPPRDGEPYSVQVHDQARFDALEAGGDLYSEAHRGSHGPLVDGRAASQ